jgi:mRNA degradation ribonuclease J1/J2
MAEAISHRRQLAEDGLIIVHLSPDAEWAVWEGAVHEALGRVLFKRTHRRPLILPVVTEV